jgi:hypothetical protein
VAPTTEVIKFRVTLFSSHVGSVIGGSVIGGSVIVGSVMVGSVIVCTFNSVLL